MFDEYSWYDVLERLKDSGKLKRFSNSSAFGTKSYQDSAVKRLLIWKAAWEPIWSVNTRDFPILYLTSVRIGCFRAQGTITSANHLRTTYCTSGKRSMSWQLHSIGPASRCDLSEATKREGRRISYGQHINLWAREASHRKSITINNLPAPMMTLLPCTPNPARGARDRYQTHSRLLTKARVLQQISSELLPAVSRFQVKSCHEVILHF